MNSPRPARPIGPLLGACFLASAGLYALLLWMGPLYALDIDVSERPLLTVIGLYVAACLLYLVALGRAVRLRSSRRLGWWVIGTSVALRALLLPSPPFQEIDIYRYLWDGAVVVAGADPYTHPPAQVVAGLDAPAETPSDGRLAKLVALAEDSPALDRVVRTIHYGDLPSPYPPVSQAVFAAAAASTPVGWSAYARLVWLKGWLTLFDLATLLLVLDLLRTTRLPIGWGLAYGWAPLVLKEYAGSGHLDTIAACLAVASLAVGARLLVGDRRPATPGAVGAAALLGLGVGAKLFPVVLAPLLAAGLLARCGWRTTLLASSVFVATSTGTLAPMLLPADSAATAPPGVAGAADPGTKNGVVALPPPPGVPAVEGTSKTAGIVAFLQEWEMNDLLFMFLYENFRSQAGVPPDRKPWFDFTPEAWNAPLAGRDPFAFATTRTVTLLVFTTLAVGWATRAAYRLNGTHESVRNWLRAAFLTLAWFWLLAPTQNPWYWCWAVPLLPWAGGRAWLAVSACAFAYYLRFWLVAHFPAPGVAGTPYAGEHFFYFVVPWFEFGPLLIWLALESRIARSAARLYTRLPTSA